MENYTIKIAGQVDEEEINVASPWQMRVIGQSPRATFLTVCTDQSGLVGLLRHLHGVGFDLLAVEGASAEMATEQHAGAESGRPMSRRAFLKGAGLAVGGAGLAACGILALEPDPAAVRLPSFSYGEKQMNNRILVAYATYAGSTVDVAVSLGETLTERDFAVDVKPMKENPPVGDYRTAVLGSAVQHGQWLPEALAFVENNQEALQQRPVALFCVHIQSLGDDEVSRRKRLAYLDDVRRLVDPIAEGFFAGRFDRRGAQLMLPSLLARLVPPLDFRNWDKIRGWAEGLGPL